MAEFGSRRSDDLRSAVVVAGLILLIIIGVAFVAVVLVLSPPPGFVSSSSSSDIIVNSVNRTKADDDSPGNNNLIKTVLHLTRKKQRPALALHKDVEHVWPGMRFGWEIILGTVIGVLGAAFGSVGGIGGGGIFVPMLNVVIGFDAKSSIALSKCMVMGTAISTVCYNLKLRHPTLDLPIIDYNLALLMQPMLLLGISLGVALNVIFAYWMITMVLIILFLAISIRAFLTGIRRWKKETIVKKEAAKPFEINNGEVRNEVVVQLANSSRDAQLNTKTKEVSILQNVDWKQLGVLLIVWFLMLGIQIAKNYTTRCAVTYWLLNLVQIPIAIGVSSYEAINLYKGRTLIAIDRRSSTNWKVHQLVLYGFCSLLAGTFGGLLGLGGGFILGPLFVELGIPPQVASATSTFILTFSSSLSVVEYYILKRFPIPYALYLFGVATIAAIVGQHVVTKAINLLGRASIIIFVLAFTIFASAILLGGLGVSNMIKKIELHEYMGFESICK